MSRAGLIKIIVGTLFLVGGFTLAYVWGFCRVTVEPNQCLVLISKSGKQPPPGQTIAGPGERGVRRETLGPGRYFFNPWTTEWETKPLVVIPAGNPEAWREYYEHAVPDALNSAKAKEDWPMVGILVNKVGKPAPAGQEVVDEGYQGIQKHVLTPGTYRINPYVYEVKLERATVVPLGYCGVVTSQLGEMPGTETVRDTSIGPDGQPIAGETKVIQKLATEGQRGVQERVLSPGIYYLNPYVHRVQIVELGYNEISQLRASDALNDEHIRFPSRDGFTIDLEVTVVWGRHPAHTAEMINRFGDVNLIKQIVIGQMRSICRNVGSQYQSTDFISGEKREAYQQQVTETLKRVCEERDIEILIALIRNIEVQASETAAREGLDLKATIQAGFIAREQDLTKQAQRETARVRAELETAKVNVEVAREKVTADSRLKVAGIKAEGQKQAEEIRAARDLAVAKIEQEMALLESETTRVMGKAKAQVEQLKNQAEADGKRMMVQAFGNGNSYNLYTFAESFAPESIRLIFAGEGTFWTDLSRLQDAAALELLKQRPDKSQ
jgi:hypothetical protein